MTSYSLEKWGCVGVLLLLLFCLVFTQTSICSWDSEAAQRIGKVQVQKMKYVVSHIKVPVNKLSGEQSEYNSKIYQCRVRLIQKGEKCHFRWGLLREWDHSKIMLFFNHYFEISKYVHYKKRRGKCFILFFFYMRLLTLK